MRSRWLWLVTALACNGASARDAKNLNDASRHASHDPNETQAPAHENASGADGDELHGGPASGADLRLLVLLAPLIDGASLLAWTHPSGRKFAMSSQQKPAHLLAGLVTIPKAGIPTRDTDRALAVTNLWTASRTGVNRAARFVVGSGPIQCDEAPCLDVELDVQPDADGALSVTEQRCTEQLANQKVTKPDGTPLDTFDRAVIPAICANSVRWTWSGTKFEKTQTRKAAALKATAPSAPTSPVAISTGLDAAALLVAPLAEGSLGEFVPTSVWHPDEHDLTTAFGLVERLEPSQDSTLRQSKASKLDANGTRSVASHEVWITGADAMRKAFTIPTGIRSLACLPPAPVPPKPGVPPPKPDMSRKARCVVFELSARIVDGALVIEDTGDECANAPASLDAWDKSAVAKMCGQRGRYKWDGRDFVRSVRARVGTLSRDPRQ